MPVIIECKSGKHALRWTVRSVNEFEQRFAKAGVGVAWQLASDNVTLLSQLLWMCLLDETPTATPNDALGVFQDFLDAGHKVSDLSEAMFEAGVAGGFLVPFKAADPNPEGESV
jgi:hypothetical protein